jgi:uroporphyrinogen decarboxylase
MLKGIGPNFPDPLSIPADLKKLTKDVDVDAALGYVYDAISLTRHRLEGKVPLFGFCGAPWTVMAYMCEGKGTKLFSRSKSWLFAHPEASHELLEMITSVRRPHC